MKLTFLEASNGLRLSKHFTSENKFRPTEAEERAAKQIKEIEAQTRKELQAEIQAADFMFRSSMLVAAMDTERQGAASDEAQRLAEKLAETNG